MIIGLCSCRHVCLQIKIGKDKVVPIAKFRGTTRPVLIIGSKGHIQKVLKAAEPLVADLRLRGVSVITLQTDDADFTQQLRNLKEEFRQAQLALVTLITVT